MDDQGTGEPTDSSLRWSLGPGDEAIRQVAALPYRIDDSREGGEVQILLVTSRTSRRWLIPKGNRGFGRTSYAAAATEAEEEGGIRGSIARMPIGSYHYRKRRSARSSPVIEVDVFPMKVTHELAIWKEQGQRERQWFARSDAAALVEEPELQELLRTFDPRVLDSMMRHKATTAHSSRHVGPSSMPLWFRRFFARS